MMVDASVDSPLLIAALEYARQGWRIFPLAPGSKKPLEGSAGFKDATDDMATVRAWWEANPQANIGLATAGLLAVDIDPEGLAWFHGLDHELRLDLGRGRRSQTPRGGSHFIFRQPEGANWASGQSVITKGVDHKADDGYIVAPPSIYKGRPYSWTEGAMAPDFGPEDLAEPAAWLVKLLKRKPAAQRDIKPGNMIPAGQRHPALVKLAGHMRHVGMTPDEILGALQVVNAQRCETPKSDKELRKIADSFGKYQPDQVATAIAEGHFDQQFTGRSLRVGSAVISWGQPPTEQAGPHNQAAELADPGPLPEHLLEVPGFIGEMMRWNLATTYRPQPALALAGAIAAQATLAGRKLKDALGNRTNLYIVSTAPSGTGKDHALKINARLFVAAGADMLLGPGELASDSGLSNHVEKHPASLLQIDELGKMFRAIGSAKNAPHLANITVVFTKLWSAADGLWIGKGYADTARNARVYQPCLILHGVSVPSDFYNGLTLTTLADGFVARLLVFDGETDPASQQTTPAEPRPELIETARWWAQHTPGGNLGGQFPQPRVVEHSLEATARFEQLVDLAAEQSYGAEDSTRAIWARSAQQAYRLALVYAASANHESPAIDLEAATWACELAEYNTRRLLYLASQWVADSDFDKRQLRVVRFVREKGGQVSRSQLTRLLQREPKRQREELIENLVETGQLSLELVTQPGRGKTKTLYVIPKQTPAAEESSSRE